MAEFYRVKQGDNLNGIARSFSLSIEEIKQANGITEIYEGQLLMIPSCS
ncbi:MAG: LysM peptidoglycan-binding domain-containing protein, partial [Clostridia bacterium]|nr:LysM peptidoglycan-binding domain-containing protein [Clostridia bacterium]